MTDYFENTKGHGVLSTCDKDGRINSAVFGRPHIDQGDGTLSFIMPGKRTYANLAENFHATYLFIEEGQGWRGKRLQLTKVGETNARELIEPLRRRTYSAADEAKVGPLFLVSFRLDEELPLLGEGPGA